MNTSPCGTLRRGAAWRMIAMDDRKTPASPRDLWERRTRATSNLPTSTCAQWCSLPRYYPRPQHTPCMCSCLCPWKRRRHLSPNVRRGSAACRRPRCDRVPEDLPHLDVQLPHAYEVYGKRDLTCSNRDSVHRDAAVSRSGFRGRPSAQLPVPVPPRCRDADWRQCDSSRCTSTLP